MDLGVFYLRGGWLRTARGRNARRVTGWRLGAPELCGADALRREALASTLGHMRVSPATALRPCPSPRLAREQVLSPSAPCRRRHPGRARRTPRPGRAPSATTRSPPRPQRLKAVTRHASAAALAICRARRSIDCGVHSGTSRPMAAVSSKLLAANSARLAAKGALPSARLAPASRSARLPSRSQKSATSWWSRPPSRAPGRGATRAPALCPVHLHRLRRGSSAAQSCQYVAYEAGLAPACGPHRLLHERRDEDLVVG